VLLADRFHVSLRCTAMGFAYHGTHLIIESTYVPLSRWAWARGRHANVHAGSNGGPNVFYMLVILAGVAAVSATAAWTSGRYMEQPLCARSPLVSECVGVLTGARARHAAAGQEGSGPQLPAMEDGPTDAGREEKGPEASSRENTEMKLEDGPL
jgi:hypothetical protein